MVGPLYSAGRISTIGQKLYGLHASCHDARAPCAGPCGACKPPSPRVLASAARRSRAAWRTDMSGRGCGARLACRSPKPGGERLRSPPTLLCMHAWGQSPPPPLTHPALERHPAADTHLRRRRRAAKGRRRGKGRRSPACGHRCRCGGWCGGNDACLEREHAVFRGVVRERAKVAWQAGAAGARRCCGME